MLNIDVIAWPISIRENLELYSQHDTDRYVEVLKDERGATDHPNQEGAYILDACPFCSPRSSGDHLSILSFKHVPLSDSLMQALVDHPEFFPDGILVRWTREQDLILEATLGQLRGRRAER
jgi:hypothetical protein